MHPPERGYQKLTPRGDNGGMIQRLHPKSRPRSKRGFNLIEAAIVLGVVGLVIGGLWVAAAKVRENMFVSDIKTFILWTQEEGSKFAHSGDGVSFILAPVISGNPAPGGFLYDYSADPGDEGVWINGHVFAWVSVNYDAPLWWGLPNSIYTSIGFLDNTTNWNSMPQPAVCTQLFAWMLSLRSSQRAVVQWYMGGTEETLNYDDPAPDMATIATKCQTIDYIGIAPPL